MLGLRGAARRGFGDPLGSWHHQSAHPHYGGEVIRWRNCLKLQGICLNPQRIYRWGGQRSSRAIEPPPPK
jgi:hypothetical protein